MWSVSATDPLEILSCVIETRLKHETNCFLFPDLIFRNGLALVTLAPLRLQLQNGSGAGCLDDSTFTCLKTECRLHNVDCQETNLAFILSKASMTQQV